MAEPRDAKTGHPDAHLLLVGQFVVERAVQDVLGMRDWKSQSGEAPLLTIERAIADGLLRPADLAEQLEDACTVREMREMLRERDLPVSGLKAILAERLVEEDPDGIRQALGGRLVLQCTELGKRRFSGYLRTPKAQIELTRLFEGRGGEIAKENVRVLVGEAAIEGDKWLLDRRGRADDTDQPQTTEEPETTRRGGDEAAHPTIRVTSGDASATWTPPHPGARDASAYYNRGVACEESGQYREALEEYSRAIELDPQYALAYYNRGLAHNALERYTRATSDYSKAIELDPQYALAYYNRGLAHYELGRYTRAISDYNKAIELDPRHAPAYNNRGNAHYGLERYEQAISDYNKAIELDPRDTISYYNRGNALKALGRHDQAIADYNKAIELEPQYALAYHNRGNAHYELERYEQAISDYNKAIELDPRHTWAYYNRGNAHYGLKRYEQAISDYNRAIELDPRPAITYYNRGLAHKALGHYKPAIDDYGCALRLTSDPEQAREIEDRVSALRFVTRGRRWLGRRR